jgi:hypothetical protein
MNHRERIMILCHCDADLVDVADLWIVSLVGRCVNMGDFFVARLHDGLVELDVLLWHYL